MSSLILCIIGIGPLIFGFISLVCGIGIKGKSKYLEVLWIEFKKIMLIKVLKPYLSVIIIKS